MDLREARQILGVGDTAGATEVEAAYHARVAKSHVDLSDPAEAEAHRKRLVVARNVLFGRPADAPAPEAPSAPSPSFRLALEEPAPTAKSTPQRPSPPPSPSPAARKGDKPAPSAPPAPSPSFRLALDEPAPTAKSTSQKPSLPPTPSAAARKGDKPAPAAFSGPSAPKSRSVMDAGASPPRAEAARAADPAKRRRLLLIGGGALGVVVLGVVAMKVFSSSPVTLPNALTAEVAALRKTAMGARTGGLKEPDAEQAAAEAAEREALAKAASGGEGAVATMEKARDAWRVVARRRVVAPAALKAGKARDEWKTIQRHVPGGATKSSAAADAAFSKGEELAKGSDLRGAATALLDAERLYTEATIHDGKAALEKAADAVTRRALEATTLATATLARKDEAEGAVKAAAAELEAATGGGRAAAARTVVAARLVSRSLDAEMSAFSDDKEHAARVAQGKTLVDQARRAGRDGKLAAMAETLAKAQDVAEQLMSRATLFAESVNAVLHPPSSAAQGAGVFTRAAGPSNDVAPALSTALSQASLRLDLAADRTFSLSTRVGAATGYTAGVWIRDAGGAVRLDVFEEEGASLPEPVTMAATVAADAAAKTFTFRGGDVTGTAADLRPLLRAVVLDLRERWKTTGLLKDTAPPADAAAPADGAPPPEAPAPPAAPLTPEAARTSATQRLSSAGDGAELVKAQLEAMAVIAAAERAAAEAASPRMQAAARDLAALESATKIFLDPDAPRASYAPALAAIVQAEAGLATATASGPVADGPVVPAARYTISMEAWPAPARIKAGLDSDDVILDLRRDGVFTLSTHLADSTHSWAGTWTPATSEEGAAILVVRADAREVLATPIPSADWWVKVFPKKSTFAFRTARFGGKVPWAAAVEPLVKLEARGLVLKGPPEGKVYDRGENVRVIGTVVPVPGATLTVNGKPVSLIKGEFSVSLTPPEGESTFRVDVAYGGDAVAPIAASRTVEIDTLAPRLAVTTPVQALSTYDDPVAALRGEVLDAHIDRVAVNNQPVALHDEGAGKWSFSTTIRLAGGDDTRVTIVAYDTVGHACEPVYRRFRYVPPQPDVIVILPGTTPSASPLESSMMILDAPLDGGAYPGRSLSFSGRLKGSFQPGDAVFVNGAPATATAGNGFGGLVPFLAFGWHVVVVELRRAGVAIPGERIVCRVLAGG